LIDVPLLGAREMSVDGSPARCIRVLMHCYSDKSRSEIRHVYEGEAKRLREDLARG
jgi:chorismate mutase